MSKWVVQENECFRYVLSGIVLWRGTPGKHDESDHYTAYVRLSTGAWEFHDNVTVYVKQNPPTDIDVNAHLIIYTVADQVSILTMLKCY